MVAGSKTVFTLLDKICHCGTYQIEQEDNMSLHKFVKGPNLCTGLTLPPYTISL